MLFDKRVGKNKPDFPFGNRLGKLLYSILPFLIGNIPSSQIGQKGYPESIIDQFDQSFHAPTFENDFTAFFHLIFFQV